MSIDIDTGQVLAGLKDFQRATVEHAFHRLFNAPDSTIVGNGSAGCSNA